MRKVVADANNFSPLPSSTGDFNFKFCEVWSSLCMQITAWKGPNTDFFLVRIFLYLGYSGGIERGQFHEMS